MHTKNNTKQKSGFTIIEVVLVLAIAGLIFLMVFVALPALQRSQRDTQRRDDMSRLATALTNYQTNNNGKLPGTKTTEVNSFVNSYLKVNGDTFADPTGEDYKVTIKAATGTMGSSSAPTYPNVYVMTYAQCNGEGITYVKGKSTKYAIWMKLEGGGVYCQDNG